MRSLSEIELLVKQGDVHAFYNSHYWNKKRESILKRDHYQCQRCLGNLKTDEPIKRIRLTKAKYVHHIIELKEDFEKALDDDNLISLCFNCHEIVHKRNEFRMINEKKEKITEEKW